MCVCEERTELDVIEAVGAEFAVEGAAAHAEFFGGGRPIAVGFLEGFDYELLLGVFDV